MNPAYRRCLRFVFCLLDASWVCELVFLDVPEREGLDGFPGFFTRPWPPEEIRGSFFVTRDETLKIKLLALV